MKKLSFILLSVLFFSCEKENFNVVGCECNDGSYFSYSYIIQTLNISPTDTSVCSKTTFYPEPNLKVMFPKPHGGFKQYRFSNNDVDYPSYTFRLGSNKTPNNGCVGKRTTSIQCGGTTQSGSRCKNNTLSCNGNCYLHGGN